MKKLYRVSSKMAFFTVCLCGSLTFYTYLAGLTSTLTIDIFKLPIHELKDLLDQNDYQIVTYKGENLRKMRLSSHQFDKTIVSGAIDSKGSLQY